MVIAKNLVFKSVFCKCVLVVAILVTSKVSVYAGEAEAYVANARVRLLTEAQAIQPGSTFWVGLEMAMDDHWHSYWKNSGDSGMPTRIEWHLPPGFEAGPVHWPNPVRMDYQEDLTSYVLGETFLLLSEIKAPQDLDEGNVPVHATIKWLSCKDICVPGQTELSLLLPVNEKAPQVDEEVRARFMAVRERWPVFDSKWEITAQQQKDAFTIHLMPPNDFTGQLTHLQFFPYRNDVIDHAAQQFFQKDQQGYQLTCVKSVLLDPGEAIDRLEGVFVADRSWVSDENRLGHWAQIGLRDDQL